MGDIVYTGDYIGALRYLGPLDDTQQNINISQIWCGIELSENQGNMDGSVQIEAEDGSVKMVRYFDTNNGSNYGVMLPAIEIIKTITPWELLVKVTELNECLADARDEIATLHFKLRNNNNMVNNNNSNQFQQQILMSPRNSLQQMHSNLSNHSNQKKASIFNKNKQNASVKSVSTNSNSYTPPAPQKPQQQQQPQHQLQQQQQLQQQHEYMPPSQIVNTTLMKQLTPEMNETREITTVMAANNNRSLNASNSNEILSYHSSNSTTHTIHTQQTAQTVPSSTIVQPGNSNQNTGIMKSLPHIHNNINPNDNYNFNYNKKLLKYNMVVSWPRGTVWSILLRRVSIR